MDIWELEACLTRIHQKRYFLKEKDILIDAGIEPAIS
jgi:hypothetical protein